VSRDDASFLRLCRLACSIATLIPDWCEIYVPASAINIELSIIPSYFARRAAGQKPQRRTAVSHKAGTMGLPKIYNPYYLAFVATIGAIKSQDLWINRFDAVRETFLGEDPATIFDHTAIGKFLAIIVHAVRAHRGRNEPNLTKFINCIRILISYGHFTFPDFKWGLYQEEHVKRYLAKLCFGPRYSQGPSARWKWVTSSILARMERAWLQTHTDDRTRSWDQILGRMMFVVLIATANLRAGEFVCSRHYTGEEYLKWKHITVRLHDRPDVDDEIPRLQDIESSSNCTLKRHLRQHHLSNVGKDNNISCSQARHSAPVRPAGAV
jgi:hypothetical protein